MDWRSDYSINVVNAVGTYLGTVDCSFELDGGHYRFADVISGLVPAAVNSVFTDLLRDIPRRCVGVRAEGEPYGAPVTHTVEHTVSRIRYVCQITVSMRPGIKAISHRELVEITEHAVLGVLIGLARKAEQLLPHLPQLTRN